ncbi:MAG TPA: energy-coupling factor ABC transporter permease [Alicyclobacillus sp.]|nr:energy-coupling factor ABC transporter permease [Alicyclobacillus sp.]
MVRWVILVLFMAFWLPRQAYAMHIMEGYLPLGWCLFWAVLCLPALILGTRSLQKQAGDNLKMKLVLALSAAFAFVLSALKLPSVTGSSSHPTGVGLGAVLFGPMAMSVVGCIILLFQALLLAHGGITTLGANTFSMAVVGPTVSYLVFRVVHKYGFGRGVAVFLAAALGDLSTYVTTSFQLALAFPAPIGGVAASFWKFASIFAVTQVPLAVSEGLLTVITVNWVMKYNPEVLSRAMNLAEEAHHEA